MQIVVSQLTKTNQSSKEAFRPCASEEINENDVIDRQLRLEAFSISSSRGSSIALKTQLLFTSLSSTWRSRTGKSLYLKRSAANLRIFLQQLLVNCK